MTGKQRRLAARLTAEITQVLTVIGSDPITLLEVVAAGPFTWRVRFLREFRGYPVDATMADRVFAFFEHIKQRKYGDVSARELLDSVTESSPPTQAEIDNGWEVESLSSENGRRHLYGPDGHPEELIKKLVES